MQKVEQMLQKAGKGNGELFLHGYYYYCLFAAAARSLQLCPIL